MKGANTLLAHLVCVQYKNRQDHRSGRPQRLEKRRGGVHTGSMKKPWKIVACIPAVDEAPGYHEYFIVRATDRHTALATLRKARKDLLDIACEVKGEAGHDFLDWLEFDKDVFSIIVG
jgi:hypothetical protein